MCQLISELHTFSLAPTPRSPHNIRDLLSPHNITPHTFCPHPHFLLIMVHTRHSTLAQPSMSATRSVNLSIFFALNSNNQSYSYVVRCGGVRTVLILSLISFFHNQCVLISAYLCFLSDVRKCLDSKDKHCAKSHHHAHHTQRY